nr:MAG TPA: 30S ribosomal protein S2 [Caudoviricetes sp.]
MSIHRQGNSACYAYFTALEFIQFETKKSLHPLSHNGCRRT